MKKIFLILSITFASTSLAMDSFSGKKRGKEEEGCFVRNNPLSKSTCPDAPKNSSKAQEEFSKWQGQNS